MPIHPRHRDLANSLRFLAIDAVERAKSGHPGMPMGMADVATVLFSQHLRFDPAAPDWPDRDRFVLSAGHGSMLLYGLLHLTGYEGMTLEDLKAFRQWGSPAAGHPEYGHAPGIETTTGPLGQGLATAVGMALAERLLAARFGADLVDHRTFVLASDGDLMEGIAQEAISLAGHLRLNRLIVLWDDNAISIDGATALSDSTDQLARFAACGWRAERIDGHDPAAIDAALTRAASADRPSLIACRTTIGYGAPTKAGSAEAHGAPLGAAEIAGARAGLGWTHAPFEVPEDLRADWAAIGARGKTQRQDWERRAATHPLGRAFAAVLAGNMSSVVTEKLTALARDWASAPKSDATRKWSGATLDAIAPLAPELIGGSADLTGSNNTLAKGMGPIAAPDYTGRYMHWGIREHAMAAAMNGMALHGGIVPYAGTFLVFADYCRPAIRLAALMKQRVVHVMTHDSIGLGEDGPTHQPIEHLASLRAIPNVAVFRPCDAVETAECWAAALARRDGPSVIALTRQKTTPARGAIGVGAEANLSARGAYELCGPLDSGAAAQVTLIATGSEMGLAIEARRLLADQGIAARIVSMPCWLLFERQDAAYQQAVLGDAPRLAIEAASPFGWERWTGPRGGFVGLRDFGASAPFEELYQRFGLTAAAVVAAAIALVR